MKIDTAFNWVLLFGLVSACLLVLGFAIWVWVGIWALL